MGRKKEGAVVGDARRGEGVDLSPLSSSTAERGLMANRARRRTSVGAREGVTGPGSLIATHLGPIPMGRRRRPQKGGQRSREGRVCESHGSDADGAGVRCFCFFIDDGDEMGL